MASTGATGIRLSLAFGNNVDLFLNISAVERRKCELWWKPKQQITVMIHWSLSVFSNKAKTPRNHLDYSKVSLKLISFSMQSVHLQTAGSNAPDHK